MPLPASSSHQVSSSHLVSQLFSPQWSYHVCNAATELNCLALHTDLGLNIFIPRVTLYFPSATISQPAPQPISRNNACSSGPNSNTTSVTNSSLEINILYWESLLGAVISNVSHFSFLLALETILFYLWWFVDASSFTQASSLQSKQAFCYT